jgi:hypothetical protein
MNCLDAFDEELVKNVLEHARLHSDAVLSACDAFVVVPGFVCEPFTFDVVAAAGPSVHGYHAGRNELLGRTVFAVFPAFHCEFSGAESAGETTSRFKRMLRPALIHRQPVPFLRMRYHNPRTKARSVGPDRGLATIDVLVRELELLEGVAGAFIQCENYKGQVLSVRWDDGEWIVDGAWRETLNRDRLGVWVKNVFAC